MTGKSDEQLHFRCSYCSKKLRGKESLAGRKLKCPNCGRDIEVPQSGGPSTTVKPEGTPRRSLFDVDELVLEEPAIDNLEERKRFSQSIQEEKAAQRRRNLIAEQNRRSQAKPSEEVVQPHSRRQVFESQFKDAYTDLEPDHSTDSADSSSGSSKQSVFDEPMPELLDVPPEGSLPPSKGDASDMEKIAASFGDQPIPLDPDLDQLIPLSPVEQIEEKYRVICPTCGTMQYVGRSQQGSKVKCPDCTSKFTVPPPPANWKPSLISARHNQFNDQSPMVENNELRQIDRQKQQRTQAMLERAKVELSEEADRESQYGADFDTSGFLRRTFGFFTDPVAIGIIFGYSVVFALVFAMLQYGLSSDGSFFRQGAMLFCALIGPLLGIVFGMPMISAALAQLESAANHEDRVKDWPSMNIFEHFGDVMAVCVAMTASAMPGFLLGLWLGANLEGAGRLQLTGVMLTCFLLFPIFYLSILDGSSILNLISLDVVRSIREVSEAWGGFYLKTLFAFSFTLISWYLLLGQGKSPVLAAIGGAMLPWLVFFTFQQLGLLADSIGENLSPSEDVSQSDDQKDNSNRPDSQPNESD